VEISCGHARFKLNGLPADEFPVLPSVDFGNGVEVNCKDLQSLVHHTSFAVSSEESRPILNGVLWELKDGQMRMVATNGHRLARMSVKSGPSEAVGSSFIVAPPALQQVQRLLKDVDSIQVGWDSSGDGAKKNHLAFRSSSVEIYTRLIEGTYPNYEQVIPKDNDKVAVVDKRALESAVRRMAVVASDQTHRIRVTLEENRMHLNVLTPDLGEGHDELDLTYGGEPLEIGFNANYLLEVLRYMPSDEVRMTFKAPERAATLEPSVAEGDDPVDYLCLVMPLRLLD
jgi:DNA polymerase-3 subunit beta